MIPAGGKTKECAFGRYMNGTVDIFGK